MKKLITLALVAFTVSFITSCTKDGSSVIANPGGGQTGGNQTATVKLVSAWLSLSFAQTVNNPSTLSANYAFGASYDPSQDKAFAYERVGKGAFVQALPSTVVTADGVADLSFGIASNTLTVIAKPAQSSEAKMGPESLGNMQFRLIIVSNDYYQQHGEIDWSDYEKVAAALNISL
jgi:hypothetical protein